MVRMISGRFCTRDTNRSIPACTISGNPSSSPVTMPSMICGRTSTIAAMMSGSASTSAVRS